MTDIQALNAILVQLGGTTTYTRNIQAYNAWSVLQGGTGAYTRDIDALNAIDVLNGGSGGHRYNIKALNSIDVAAGGTGGHTRDISALTSLGTLLNYPPAYNLATLWLDGSIVDVEGAKYFVDKKAGNNVLITGYDFPTGWTTGFPYKSAATIDIFGQTAVPVVSLFQNFDYANQFFTKHVAQVVDINGVETSEAYVSDIVAYSEALAGDDLAEAITYFAVPTESATAVWVAKTGNDTTGNGTKANPYKTITKAIAVGSAGGKIYVRSGEYVEARTFDFLYINVVRHIEGLGRVKLLSNNSADYIIQFAAAANTSSLKRIWFDYGTENYMLSINCAVTVEKCYIENGDIGSVISTPSGGLSPTLKDCIIVSLTKPISSNIYDALFTNCYLLSNAASTNITVGGGSLFKLEYCRIKTQAAGRFMYHNIAAGAVEIKHSKFTVNADIDSIYSNNAVNANTLTFSYNELITDKDFTSFVIRAAQTSTIKNNIITLTNTAIDSCVVLFNNGTSLDAQSNLITTNTINNLPVFGIWQTTGTPSTTSIKIKYNKIFAKNQSGYIVRVGDEATNAFNNTIQGIEVIGNYIKNLGAGGTTHAIFVGHNINALIRYNYVIDFELVGYKHTGGVITSGDVSYNIFKNCELICIGLQNAKMYNNTIQMDKAANTAGLALNANAGGEPTNSEVKNNIVTAADTAYVYSIALTKSGIAFVFDYNNYFAADGSEVFYIDGAAKTKAQWLAAGFDAHTLFTNPNLVNNIPSTPIAGVALDAAYDDGLDYSTAWGNDTTLPVIVTKQQAAAWDCGAYVH